MEWVSKNTSDLGQIADGLIEAAQNRTTWLLEGEMGAGKTTLVKAICLSLGVVSAVQSPTFSIVNEYVTDQKQTIYHFDCYRLKDDNEAFDIGLEEYLDSGCICLIEWPDKIASLLAEPVFKITIAVQADQTRRVVCV